MLGEVDFRFGIYDSLMQCKLFLESDGFDREGICSSLGGFRCTDNCNKAQLFQPWPIINSKK
jgi:hypothetical protein